MIKNYIKTAFRTLTKNKGFTAINVLGLALGLATCMLIVFYVADELSYDRFNVNADRIFRVNNDIKFGGNENSYAQSPAPMAATLKSDFPEVEQVVRFRGQGGYKVKKGSQNIQEHRVIYTDPSVFSVFTLPMISGNPNKALTETHSVVITERIAQKYFNTTQAVGRVLIFNDSVLYKITGVIKNIPAQSHFNFDFFIAMTGLKESKTTSWLSSNNFNTYILLKKGADYKKLQAKMPSFLEKHAGAELQNILHLTFKDFEQDGNYFKFNFIPLKKIHLESNRVGELSANGNLQYVYIFSAIAIFILLIACVNFMNLSTARSSNRAREIGVRKVLGSPRRFLIAQFLTESIMITLAAAIIAVFAACILLPLFNQIAGKELTVTKQIIWWMVPALISIVFVIGCLAGSYPALYLSAFQPIEVLKGKTATGFKGGILRSFLVVFQFSISIFLIIGTIVIYSQLKYIQSTDLGYNRDHILIVQNSWSLGGKAKAFKQEIKQITGVQSATLTQALPTADYGNGNTVFKTPVANQKSAILTQMWPVDEDYIPTLGIKIAAGRNFSNQMPTDSSAIIINATAAKLLGFSNPLNQTLYRPMDNELKRFRPLHIIGVMKDFNFNSLRQNITPMIIYLDNDESSLSIRFNSANIPMLIGQIKSKWSAF
ncbi:MAG TPA: ABC transporter permease, partial [Mucilaginibacter sp.]